MNRTTRHPTGLRPRQLDSLIHMGSCFSASMCEPDPRRGVGSSPTSLSFRHRDTDGLDRWIDGRGEQERWRPSIPGPDGGDR